MATHSSLVERLALALSDQDMRLTTVESCTGGQIGALLTERAGSSDWYEGGWITYSNARKVALGVPEALISEHGAVSEMVARAMAEAGRRAAGVALSLAVTGIAGPGGGSAEKPVGTVWLAWATPFGTDAERFVFTGDRIQVRNQAVETALSGLLRRL